MSETETMIGEVREYIETLEIRKFTIDSIQTKLESVIAIHKAKGLKISSSLPTQTNSDYKRRIPNFRYTHMVLPTNKKRTQIRYSHFCSEFIELCREGLIALENNASNIYYVGQGIDSAAVGPCSEEEIDSLKKIVVILTRTSSEKVIS